MKKNISDEKAYITVETLGSFIPFALLVVSILSLVNIVTAQTRIHYALTQAANTISVYGHLPNLVSPKGTGGLNDSVGEIVDLATACAADDFKYPNETEIRDLIGRYLSNGALSGGEYLKSANVIGGLDGLELHNSDFLADENGEVSLVVEYEIEYRFGALPLPFEPKLKVTQQAKTKIWKGGAGEGYAWDG